MEGGIGQASPSSVDFAPYAAFASSTTLREVIGTAPLLRDVRVLHVSTGPPDSATAHLLEWLVPVMHALGIETEWRVISLDAREDVAPILRHVLGVAAAALPQALWQDLVELNRRVAARIEDEWDVIVAHDVELALLASVAGGSRARWLLRPGALMPALDVGAAGEFGFHLDRYSGVIVDVDGPPSVGGRPAWRIPVGVDPLAPATRELESGAVRMLCEGLGLDPSRPIVVHSTCYSGLSGISEAIDAYWAIKGSLSDLQFAVLGPVVSNSADGARADALAARASEDPDLHVLPAVSQSEINAVRTRASMVVQTSHAVGSDLDVLEAWWKGRPVVRTYPRRGGIVNGPALCACTSQELASCMRVVLADSERAARLGWFGRERVRDRLLVPSSLSLWLRVLLDTVT